MNKHTIDILEFNKIIESISKYCFTDIGKQKVINYNFYFNKKEINEELSKIEEIYQNLKDQKKITFEQVEKIDKIFENLKSSGFINSFQILRLNKILKLYEKFKNFFKLNNENYPYFANIFQFDEDFKNIINKIENSISENGEILDSASHEIRSIRKQIKTLTNKVFEKLNNFTKSNKFKDILADNNYVIKDGKYLLPIKPHKKKEIPGIVQEISATGKTIFLEPFEIIELNNKILLEKAKENEEIYKILKNFSDFFLENIKVIEDFLKVYYELDCYNAKAVFFYINKYSRPILSEIKEIKLNDFYHPFLKNPVKNNLKIEKEKPILIISGPNTGGKTVTLKAIGIIFLLAKAGLFIPASDNSTIPVVREIFVDIGDEQSIDNSLSTFSSHLQNLKIITENADENDLVIIDEIGTGTSPEEGEALSCAIIERLIEKGPISIISSHFTKVKLLSTKFKEIKNGAMQFDLKNLNPLYKLVLDIPGASYAFYISKKLGLDDRLIEKAKNYISRDRNIDDIVIELQNKLSNLNLEIIEYNKKKVELDKLKLELEERIKQYNKTKNEIKKEFSEKINQEVKDLKKIVERRISILKKGGYDLNKSRELSEIINIKKNKLEKELKYDILPEENEKYNFQIGDKVLVKSIKKNGKILEIKKNRIKVSVDNITLVIEPKYLEKLENFEKPENTYSFYAKGISKKILDSIDIRGKTSIEAKDLLDDFFDSIVFTNFEKIYIIHGKGEGKLQEFVHDYLSENPFVKSFNFALPEEGGTGCTVVYLKL